jgi:hypothetical protein
MSSGSLVSCIPSALTRGLQTLSESKKEGVLKTVFHKILKPSQNVGIAPHFNSKIKGGIGATFNVELLPYLHTNIKKGIRSSDDLSMNIEYFFSDAMSFQFSRDLQGSVSSVFEFRHKF